MRGSSTFQTGSYAALLPNLFEVFFLVAFVFCFVFCECAHPSFSHLVIVHYSEGP